MGEKNNSRNMLGVVLAIGMIMNKKKNKKNDDR
jgi:hypothetical protein